MATSTVTSYQMNKYRRPKRHNNYNNNYKVLKEYRPPPRLFLVCTYEGEGKIPILATSVVAGRQPACT